MRYLLIFLLQLMSVMLLAQGKSENARVLYEEARDHYRNRALDQALDICEASLSLSPSAEAYYLNGLIYESLERDLRAVAAYEAALKLDPDYQEALFQKALIYLNYGDPGQAVKDFGALIEKGVPWETRAIYFQSDPVGDQGTSVVSLATMPGKIYYYRGQAYAKLEHYDKALADFEQAMQQEEAADYYVARGLVWDRQGKRRRAEADFKKAIAVDPSSQVAWYNLALVNPSTKLPGELLADHSFAPTLGLLAAQALADGDYKAAIRYLNQAISNHEEPLHYINRGRAYLKEEKYDLARSDFNQARKLDPARFECMHLIGNTYFYQENYSLAISFYNQYLTVDPQSAMVWYNAAICYLGLEEAMDACHYLNRANNLGMLQAKQMIDEHCR